MKQNLRNFQKLSLLFVIILLILPGAVFAEEDIYAGVKTSAVELAEAIVNDYGISAIQYALISDGQMILSGTAGTFGSMGVLDNQSLFGIGSLSKIFPVTAMMMLSDQGKVKLDEPVTTYIPEFVMADERYQDITVRMLLNHSSGIMGTTYSNSFSYDYPSTYSHDTLLSQLAKQQLKAAPGEFSVYCNDGFTLAEIVVERVSGMTFSEFVRRNITSPLGMISTYTPQDEFDRDRLVRTFVNEQETPVDTVNVIGTGGFYSTAEDLCKLAQVYMNDPGYLPSANLLSGEAKGKTMQKEYQRGFGPDQREGLFGFGLGWDSVDAYPYSQYNIQSLIKGGDTQLYHSSMIVLPEYNVAFVAVLSGGGSFFGQVMGQELILETLLAEKEIESILPPKEIMEPVLSAMPSEKTQYQGLYANWDSIREMRIGEDGKITLSALSDADIPDEIYFYTVEDVFVSEDGSKRLNFSEENNGKTYIWIKETIHVPNLGQTSTVSYKYEKIEPNIVDAATQAAWDERDGTQYFVMNENPHGQMYHAYDSICMKISINEKLPGYVGDNKITDQNRAIQDVQIPGMDSRDLVSIEIKNIDGKEYLFSNDFIAIREEDIVDLYAGEKAVCTIQKDGYARWYTINPKDVGKIMTVDLPEDASFAVYDEDSCIYFSVVQGNQPVKLPENGKVVFIGEAPGDRFTITTRDDEAQGESLYRQALSLENEKKLSQAAQLYERALPYLIEQNQALAFECGEALQRIMLIQETYPYTIEEVKDQISNKYPLVSEEIMNRWFENNEFEVYFYDDQEYYFVDAVSNLAYRHLDLMFADTTAQQVYSDLLLKINQLAEEKPENSWNQYQKPVTYHGTHTISIPRQDLPEAGTYRLWLPIPIQCGPQTQVTVDSVTPEKWVKQPPSIDEDIGLLYMEIPMEELTEDLLIQVQFSFTHYEQRFTVNPQNIGEYDKASTLYKEYTRSNGNTEITSDIHQKALEIVGTETNPYFAARKIYDAIVNHIDYGLMPHLTLWPRTSQTETDYVHQYQRGDCGAQSMYFAAMCRSIGIPARSCGGFQLFSGEFGSHFWAEFYLPNYGWVPVDTSAAQLAFYVKDATIDQKQTFIDYFFGNQDSMRCVVQKDTDKAFIPKADRMVLFSMTAQMPMVEYSIPSGDIGMVFIENWILEREN